MNFNKDVLIARLKEKTTWLGIAGAVALALGLDEGGAEGIAVALVTVLALVFPESDK